MVFGAGGGFYQGHYSPDCDRARGMAASPGPPAEARHVPQERILGGGQGGGGNPRGSPKSELSPGATQGQSQRHRSPRVEGAEEPGRDLAQ